MDKLFIAATRSTPRVEFQTTGEMSLTGRSLPEDPFEFYIPLFKWVDECTAEKVSVDIRLEYINTSSSKQIYNLLTQLKKNKMIKDLLVNWFFEEADEDGLETGKEFESMLEIPFAYHEYSEALA